MNTRDYHAFFKEKVTLEKPLPVNFQIQFIGDGYCRAEKPLLDGKYPRLLSETQESYDVSKVRECGNRCRNDAKLDPAISTDVFIVRHDARCMCVKAGDDCHDIVKAQGYMSFKMQ